MRALSLSILLLLGLVACGDNSDWKLRVGGGEGVTQASIAPFTNHSLLEKMMVAPSATQYSGQREVSFFSFDKYGVSQELSYTEKVLSDGEGSYAVVVDELIAPVMSPQRAELFKLIQKGREEFFYNHRDFRIRDLDLLVGNYRIEIQKDCPPVLGRMCSRLLIRRNIEGGSRYEVDVDLRTGLVLNQREFDSEERLVSRVGFLSLTLGPLTTEEALGLSHHSRPTWRSAIPRDGLDGLAVHAPSFPPTGFQLLEQRIVTDPLGEEWYELIYGDGIEQMFVLYALDRRASQTLDADNEVALYRNGRWTVVDGRLNGERVIVLGKVSSDDLMLALESSL